MRDVTWIKLSTDLFNNRKIKQIRKLPEGDAIIGIWLQILCLAGGINNGGLIYFSKEIPYTDDMLATEFERPINIIRLALTTFERFEMMYFCDDILCVSNWEKYQNTDALEDIKEKQRIRQRRYRENQKLLKGDVSVTLPVTVSSISTSNSISIDSYKIIIDYLNEKIGTHYKHIGKAIQKTIKGRIDEGFTVDDFKTVIDKKVQDWHGTEWESFLRPETLFCAKHFESYLNQKSKKKKDSNPFKNLIIEEAENEQNGNDSSIGNAKCTVPLLP